MPDYLLALVSTVLVFILPGLSIARVLGLRFENHAETFFYSISLSVALAVAIGFILGNTIGISVLTVLASYVVASAPAASLLIRKIWTASSKRLILRQTKLAFGKTSAFTLFLGISIVVTVTSLNWSTAIGSHAVDMGEHVFWAKTIMTSTMMPNYWSVEPLDQAVKFTYGAHLLLAQFFLLAGIPIEEYSWVPTLICSIGVFGGVVLLAFRITESKWAALIAAVLYGSAYQPYGYIERGNLPDVSGYLLLVSTLYSILRVRRTPSYSYALGLTLVSVIPYHQLATVILPLAILFTVLFSYFRDRSELVDTLRSIFAGRKHFIFWAMILLLGFAYAGTSAYVSSSAASQLETGNWRLYVPTLYEDPLVPGASLGLLGIAGAIVAVQRKALGFMLLVGWSTSLIFLTNALLIGIPIPDPLRFLWRLTEPFSILGAVFANYLIGGWRSINERNSTRLASSRQNKMRFLGSFLLIAIITVQVIALYAPALEGTPDVFSLPPRYTPAEEFYQDDKQIGLWLATNAPATAVTTNDADVDSTATWVQVYSMKLHFLYRADFAVHVAPAHYIEIYKGMAVLYESPADARVPMIIQQFNITYVVAHTDEIALFSAASCFGHAPIFQSGSSALFETKPC